MSALELNACRNELAREILATDDMEVLQAVRRAYRRAIDRVRSRTEMQNAGDVIPYTMDELNARIDEAEAEEGATPSEVFFARMEREMPWLCK